MSAPDSRLPTLLALSLGLFAVGVQVHELFATVGAWLTTVLAVVVLVRQPAWREELKAWWPLGAYLGWSLLGPLVLSAAPRATGIARLADSVFLPATAWAVASVSEHALRRIGLVASVVLVLSCVVAGAQYLGAWPPLESFDSLTWTHLSFERVYETVPGREDRFMGGGLLLHRLRFANVTAALTVLAAVGAFRLESRWRWWFAAATLIGLASVSLFPHARAATVSLVIALMVVAAFGARRRSLAIGSITAIAVLSGLIVLLVPSVRSRFASALESDGANDRSQLMQAGLSALRREPVGGTGLGRFKPGDWLEADAPEALRQHQGKTHNQFLTIAVEGGVPAALLFLAVLALMAARAVNLLPSSIGALGVLAFFVALSALHDPLFHPESSMALFGALGAGLGLARRSTETP